MKELLEKYFAGNCSAEEIVKVEKWLSDPANQLDELKQLMDSVLSMEQEEELGQEKSTAIFRQLEEKTNSFTRERLHLLRVPVWAAAACFLFFLGGLYIFQVKHKKADAYSLADLNAIIENKTGKTIAYALADGTKVYLSAHSQLRYNKDFTTPVRHVELTGEAYFKVKHDSQHAFVVHAGKLSTIDIGTAFNIEAYPGEKEIRVSLVSGKIAVSKSGSLDERSRFTLSPGQVFDYSTGTDSSHLMALPLLDEDVWTKGYLVFNDISLKDALQRVSGKFGIVVHYSPAIGAELENKKVMGVFMDENVTQVIQNMLFVHEYRYQFKNNELQILR